MGRDQGKIVFLKERISRHDIVSARQKFCKISSPSDVIVSIISTSSDGLHHHRIQYPQRFAIVEHEYSQPQAFPSAAYFNSKLRVYHFRAPWAFPISTSPPILLWQTLLQKVTGSRPLGILYLPAYCGFPRRPAVWRTPAGIRVDSFAASDSACLVFEEYTK